MARKRFTKHRLPGTLLITGIALLLVASGLLVRQVVSGRQADQAAKKAVALANQGRPSSAPATIRPTKTAVDSYHVPADHPRYITIPKFGVKARVISTGLTKNNAIGTPSNVYDTAWYNGSTLPGQTGATLIDGHVSSWTTRGVFYNLNSLQAGDQIRIELGNGIVLIYTVVKMQLYQSDNVDVSSLLAPIVKNKPGLNLITCAGDVIKGTNDFNQRIVVYASLN